MKICDVVSDKDILDIKKIGVYTISCKNKKDMYYVGSTVNSFYLRWIQHIYSLKNGIHENSKLQRVVNKYGLQSLEFEILEVIKYKNLILGIEKYWILMLDSVKCGYNLTYNTYNSLGAKKTEDTLKKYFYKVVSQYDLNGNYMQTFKSMKDAAKQTNTDYITISNVCNGKGSKLANGFQWKFGIVDKVGVVRPKSALEIHKYDKNGNYICTFRTFKEASESVGRSPNTISRSVSCGRISGGFFWSLKKCNLIEFTTFNTGLRRTKQIKL